MQITFDEESAAGIPSHHAIQSRQTEDKTTWETTRFAVAETECGWQVEDVFLVLYDRKTPARRSSESVDRHRLLNLPDMERTMQRWQSVGRSVGPAFIDKRKNKK